MNEQESPAFEAMSEALLAVTAERSVESILQKLAHAARTLAGARYAAIGIPTARARSRNSSRRG